MLISKLATLRRDVLLNMLLSSPLVPPPVRAFALRLLGMDLAPGVNIKSMCFFGGTNVAIGTETFVNYKCFFDDGGSITIGASCSLGMEVMLCTSSHEVGDSGHRAGPGVASPIRIGDGCWLATRVTVLPGVQIGDGCIVAAGSVVAGDCEANGLYAGTPARRIRELD